MTGSQISGTDRLVKVVESFVFQRRQNLSQVAAACALDPATASRYLRALVDRGWLEREPDTRTYVLGPRLFMIGEVARGSSPVRQRAVPHLRRLLARFDETVSLAVRQQHDLVVVESLESTRPMRRAAVLGEREDWFASSLGKSLLSRLPENEANTILDCNPPQLHTVNSTVDRDAILTELRAIRVRGFAVDNEETRLGLTCIGVPITDATGRYTHALSASGPTVRINEQFDDIVVAMLGIAHHISQADCKE